MNNIVNNITETVIRTLLYEGSSRIKVAPKDAEFVRQLKEAGWNTPDEFVKSIWLDVRKMPYDVRKAYNEKIHNAKQTGDWSELYQFKWNKNWYSTNNPSVPNIEKMTAKERKDFLGKIHSGLGNHEPVGNVSQGSNGDITTTPKQQTNTQQTNSQQTNTRQTSSQQTNTRQTNAQQMEPQQTNTAGVYGNVNPNNPQTWPSDARAAFQYVHHFQNNPTPGAGWRKNLMDKNVNPEFIKHVRNIINSYYAQRRGNQTAAGQAGTGQNGGQTVQEGKIRITEGQIKRLVAKAVTEAIRRIR